MKTPLRLGHLLPLLLALLLTPTLAFAAEGFKRPLPQVAMVPKG